MSRLLNKSPDSIMRKDFDFHLVQWTRVMTRIYSKIWKVFCTFKKDQRARYFFLLYILIFSQ